MDINSSLVTTTKSKTFHCSDNLYLEITLIFTVRVHSRYGAAKQRGAKNSNYLQNHLNFIRIPFTFLKALKFRSIIQQTFRYSRLLGIGWRGQSGIHPHRHLPRFRPFVRRRFFSNFCGKKRTLLWNLDDDKQNDLKTRNGVFVCGEIENFAICHVLIFYQWRINAFLWK